MTPQRLCINPGCGNITKRGKCAECRRRAAREKGPRAYDRQRYKRARKRVLAQLCECQGCDECLRMDAHGCARPAEEADHVIPLKAGGAPFALSNMRGLCRACHKERHRGEGQDRRGAAPTTPR